MCIMKKYSYNENELDFLESDSESPTSKYLTSPIFFTFLNNYFCF